MPRLDQRWKVTLVVLVGVFMSSLDLFIVNIAFPAIEHSYHGSSFSGLSWILNAYTIVFAALLVPAGRWSDRLGRRRGFLGGRGGQTSARPGPAARQTRSCRR